MKNTFHRDLEVCVKKLSFKEKYVLGVILQEAHGRWSESRAYQGLCKRLDEEMEEYRQKIPKCDFKMKYDCIWKK